MLQVASSRASMNGAVAAPIGGSQRWEYDGGCQQCTWRVVHAMWVSGCGRDSFGVRVRCENVPIFEGNRPFWASIGHTISRALRARARSAARPRASRVIAFS